MMKIFNFDTMKKLLKYIYLGIKVVTILVIPVLLISCIFDKDISLWRVDITRIVFLISFYLFLFWMGYMLFFLLKQANKDYEKRYQKILVCFYYLLVIPLGFLWIIMLLACLGSSFDDKEFEECMEKCVAADKVNIKKCAFNYCDPVF